MAPMSHFPVIFITAFAIFITATSSARPHSTTIATLDIINSLPDATTVTIKPSQLPPTSLGPGEEVKVNVTEKTLIYGQAVWLRYFASWHAYEPRRDKNNAAVFWNLKKNGIFLSWDKTNWKKEADWETD